MPVESIANLFRNLSDQLLGLTQGSSVQKSLLGIATPVTAAVAEDTFTPSTQNGSPQPPAQEAGLFQFAPGTLTANQTGLPSQPAPGVHEISGAQQAAATAKAGANGISGQPETNPPATQATTSAASAAANIQLQIQSLNAALPALGLTNTEINQIDRIASLVQNFNPAAYANLVSQFEALAQKVGPSAPTSPTVLPSTSATANPAAPEGGASYQVQEISIKFTASTQPGNSSFAGGGGKNSDGNSLQSNSAGLQFGKIQITLVNSNGQTVQVLTN
jgi:hypothetical protein